MATGPTETTAAPKPAEPPKPPATEPPKGEGEPPKADDNAPTLEDHEKRIAKLEAYAGFTRRPAS